MECPFHIKLGVTKDGQNLIVRESHCSHNHEINKCLFEHLPRQRKLDDHTLEGVKNMLKMKANKKLLQYDLSSTGKVVTLKDLHNIHKPKTHQSNISNLPGSLLQQQASKISQWSIITFSCTETVLQKTQRLKKVVKDLIFVNAAICDEVVSRGKSGQSQRRKEISFEESSPLSVPKGYLHLNNTLYLQKGYLHLNNTLYLQKGYLHLDNTLYLQKEGLPPPKPKKGGKNQPTKKVIPPLQLDSLGRPVFPLIIGDLTIHSIGEIVVDRPGFHSVSNIYPEGFCSTRVYVDVNNVDNRCLYTCKISDGGKGPVFEIASEESPGVVFYSRSISDCHNQLIKAVKKNKKLEFLEQTGKGADFFGLSHPVTQNLIQSCPGSKRCTGYRWVKFEINKNADTVEMDALDPTTSHTALKIVLNNGSKLPEPSSNLRSLLTNKALMNTAKVRQT
ncbi:Transforming growth factor beta regulator 1 [Mytilus edulis]|uniref:Transforming growth factor beta regulator 1 n=1 Tax=Mytilus edulis TaxID=6550 RepID=A0A8S3SZ85_MYTED|nr:Transforming growth factor beta regulator 1 [Mytilus edulis]